MKKSTKIIIAILVVVIVYVVVVYNQLVKKDEQVNYAWGDVQTVYQRRLDLITQLVAVVKGVSEYEQNTLVEVTKARAKTAGIEKVPSASSDSTLVQNQNQVADAANRLIVNVEKYPTITSTTNYKNLQNQLQRTELRIKISRGDYNNAVADYNRTVRKFPSSLVASIFGFKPKQSYTAKPGANEAQEIKF